MGAALVVVGSRARRPVRTRLFGSVSRTVVQRAHSPVVVVRADGAVRPGRGRRPPRPMTGAVLAGLSAEVKTMGDISLARVYDRDLAVPGPRFLVERLWPRG